MLFLFTERSRLSSWSSTCGYYHWYMFIAGFALGSSSHCSVSRSCAEFVCRISVHSSWRESTISWCEVCWLVIMQIHYALEHTLEQMKLLERGAFIWKGCIHLQGAWKVLQWMTESRSTMLQEIFVDVLVCSFEAYTYIGYTSSAKFSNI